MPAPALRAPPKLAPPSCAAAHSPAWSGGRSAKRGPLSGRAAIWDCVAGRCGLRHWPVIPVRGVRFVPRCEPPIQPVDDGASAVGQGLPRSDVRLPVRERGFPRPMHGLVLPSPVRWSSSR